MVIMVNDRDIFAHTITHEAQQSLAMRAKQIIVSGVGAVIYY